MPIDQRTKEEWDDFTEEYYEIQQESFATITTDIADYLTQIGVLPTQDFVDLAGGYGKYIPAILPAVEQYHLVDFSKKMLQKAAELYSKDNIQFIHTTQLDFFTYSAFNQYDCLFSALNPAMNSIEDLIQALRVAERYVCLVDLVEDTEELFTTIETKLYGKPAPSFLTTVVQFANENGLPWHQKEFTYTQTELLEKSFVLDYFAQELEAFPEFMTMIEHYFSDQTKKESTHTVTFSLVVLIK